jgi:O-methyltransferase involved in polyketide biosynthesis
LSLPESVHFIAADLALESISSALSRPSALSRSSFRADQTSFFSWLGVSMYLTREANLATLRSIAASACAGSELVLTYIDERLLNSRSENFQVLQQRLISIGEPFLSGFDPKGFAATLKECGLRLLEDLTGDDMAARFGSIGPTDSGHPSLSHIARAQVLDKGERHAKP